MKFFQKYSLKSRMHFLTVCIMIPWTVLTVYLLIAMINASMAYNQSVKNITIMKDYSLSFKTDLDYSMYRAIIGNLELASLDEYAKSDKTDSAKVRDPYSMIRELERAVEKQEKVSEKESADLMRRIRKSLGWLMRVVEKIDDNIRLGGHYEDNINLLEKDIHSSTQLIQDNLQEYTYYEAMNLEKIRGELEKKAGNNVVFYTVMLVAVLLFSTILTQVNIKSITEPIRELCDATQQVARGDFSPAAIDSGDEIQVLTNSFNDMTKKIQCLIEDIKREQHNLRDTELKLLQAQINPHFLYNTLDTIVWMAESGQNEEVVEMVTSLSEFFRTSLSEGRDCITIQEEESHIRSYLSIQEIRYGDIMEYEIDIPPSLYPYYILKLTLQPIVENALYHGIKNKRGKGKIKVRGFEKEEGIYLEVEDDGIGMDEQELEKVREKLRGGTAHERGFGLGNVDERIRLNYGQEYGLFFDSRKNEGTKVTVYIPKKNTPFFEKIQPAGVE